MEKRILGILEKVKDDIDNSTGLIKSSNELSENYDIPVRKLTAWFEFVYGISLKEYSKQVRIFNIRRLIINNGSISAENVADLTGYSSASGVHNFIKRSYSVGFETFVEQAKTICSKTCKYDCEHEFKRFYKQKYKQYVSTH